MGQLFSPGEQSNVIATSPKPPDSAETHLTRPIVLIVDDHLNRVDWLIDEVRTAQYTLYTAQGQGELASVLAQINSLPNAGGWIFVDAYLERFGRDFGLLKMQNLRLNDPYIAGFMIVERVLPRILTHFAQFTVTVISEQEKDYTAEIKRITKFPNCRFATKEQLRANLAQYLETAEHLKLRRGFAHHSADQQPIRPDEYLLIAKGVTADLGFRPDQLCRVLGINAVISDTELLTRISQMCDMRKRIEILLDLVELLSMIVNEDKIAEHIKASTDAALGPYSQIFLGDVLQLLLFKATLEYAVGGGL